MTLGITLSLKRFGVFQEGRNLGRNRVQRDLEKELCRMTDEKILQETLNYMGAVRMAAGRRYRWFYHLTPAGNADGIRDKGLLPHSCSSAPQPVEDALGKGANRIICFNPLGTNIVPPPVQSGPFICLAFENEALPSHVSLDWSCVGALGIARVLREEEPDRPIGEIFIEAVNRWGYMLAYDPIPRHYLRVCVKGCLPHNPKGWPMLTETENRRLMHFG